MADAIFLLVVVGFFGLMVLLVKACDHIIGPDDGVGTAPPPVTAPADAPSALVGGADERTAGAEGETPVSADNIIALVLAVLLTGYLVASLVFPEKF